MILEENNILKNITEFKNELLKKINFLEHIFIDKINLKDKEFSLKLDTINEKLIPLQKDVTNLIQNSSEKNQISQKIEILEKFINKAESMIISQNVRINKIFEEVEKIKSKYDNIFEKNFTVPGFIGHSCKYKNLSEYIIHNIKENGKKDTFTDEVNREIMTLKQRTDNLQKLYYGIFDNIYDRNNNLIENKIEYIKTFFDKKFKDIEEKISDIKVKDINNKINLDNHLEEFNLFIKDIDSIKEQFGEIKIKIEEELNKNENNDINDNKDKTEDNKDKNLDDSLEEKPNKNEIIEIKKEIKKIKDIIELIQNENRINNSKNYNKFNFSLIKLKQDIKSINSRFKDVNTQIKLQIEDNSKKIIEQIKSKLENEKSSDEKKNNTAINLININGLNILKNTFNEEMKNKDDSLNKTERGDFKNNKITKKSRNNNIILSSKRKSIEIKDLFITKMKNKINLQNKEYKEVSFNENKNNYKIYNNKLKNSSSDEKNIIIKKEEIDKDIKINKHINYAFIPNTKEDKEIQSNLILSRNKSEKDYSKSFNLSALKINYIKPKKNREFLSPIVDKMYKEYYIKNLKKNSKENIMKN
jgi:hypothetical protein